MSTSTAADVRNSRFYSRYQGDRDRLSVVRRTLDVFLIIARKRFPVSHATVHQEYIDTIEHVNDRTTRRALYGLERLGLVELCNGPTPGIHFKVSEHSPLTYRNAAGHQDPEPEPVIPPMVMKAIEVLGSWKKGGAK